MNVDFFDQAYRTEEARKDLEFGICDPAPEEKLPAYTTTNASGPHKWCAKVNANHDYKLFTRRLAYACNRRKPLVNNSHREQQQEFKRETHFTLHLSYNIDIPVSASVENLPEPTENL